MTQLRAKDDRIGRRFGVKEDSWGQGCLKKITRTGLLIVHAINVDRRVGIVRRLEMQ